MVADALKPGGRVFFFDDNYRTDAELIEGTKSVIVQRRLNDGTTALEQRLRELQWDVTVTGTSGPFYWGSGIR